MNIKSAVSLAIDTGFNYFLSAASDDLAVGLLRLSGKVAIASIIDIDAVAAAFGCMATVTNLSKRCLLGEKYVERDIKFTCCFIAARAAGVAAGVVTYGVLAANPYTRAISIGILVLSLPGFCFKACLSPEIVDALKFYIRLKS